MWVFKGLLFLVLLFTLVYFFVTNSGQVVDINFFGKTYLGISIYWVVVICFLVGFATSFILAAFRELKLHNEIRALKRQGATQDREIADLRTLPLKQDTSPGADQLQAGEGSGD